MREYWDVGWACGFKKSPAAFAQVFRDVCRVAHRVSSGFSGLRRVGIRKWLDDALLPVLS